MLKEIKFINDSPSLMINKGETRILVVADLHLGIEHSKNGINVPSQTTLIAEQLIKLIKKTNPSEIILLGDIKHSIPQITTKEWLNIPIFLKKIKNFAPLSIIRGNHDGDIDALILPSIKVHKNIVLTLNDHKIGLMHGHTMVPLPFFQTHTIIVGHNHPVIEFKDKLGVKSSKSVWIIAKWDKRRIAKVYFQYRNLKPKKNLLNQFYKKFNLKIGDPDIIIMPFFNKFIKGYPVNKKPLKLLGPIFQSQAIKLDEAEVIMLDGTYLGKLGELSSGK